MGDNMYILGQPIAVRVGYLHPIYIREYEELGSYMGSLFLDKSAILKDLKSLVESNESFRPILDFASDPNIDFYSFMMAFAIEEYENTFLYDIYKSQRELFEFIFKEDVLDKVETGEEFESYRKLIIAMNDIKYEPPNPNPELARLDRLKQELAKMKGENITFESMYTSVLMHSVVPPNDLTLYQFNKAFDRVSHLKNYETTTLFSTVDHSGKMKIAPWYGTTKEEKPATISEDQLNSARKLQKSGGLKSDL